MPGWGTTCARGDDDQAVGYGVPGGADLLTIKLRGSSARVPGPGFQLAFAAPSRDAGAAFHDAALQHGGRSNGAAGRRPDDGPDHDAAFVADPDGQPIEAVINQAP